MHESTTTGPEIVDGGKVVSSKTNGSCCRTTKPERVGSKGLSSPAKRKVVLGMFALKCQGKSSTLTSLPWVILVSMSNGVLLEPESGPAYQPMSLDPAAVYSEPDTPPPKQMLS
jgi:hypothetical protein